MCVQHPKDDKISNGLGTRDEMNSNVIFHIPFRSS
jgi:hypothetical protein